MSKPKIYVKEPSKFPKKFRAFGAKKDFFILYDCALWRLLVVGAEGAEKILWFCSRFTLIFFSNSLIFMQKCFTELQNVAQ